MPSNIRKASLSLIALTLVCILMGGPCLSSATASPLKLKIQSALPVTSNYFVEMKKCVQTIEERSNGEIVLQLFPPGALMKPMEIFDGVKRGAVDGGLSTGAYAVKKMPEGLIEMALPFSFAGKRFTMEAADQMYEFFYTWRDGIIMKTFQELYKKHNTFLVGESAASSFGFMTTFPVKRLNDMKGKKYRSFGLHSVTVKSIGASPTSITNSEQYLALQRGTVDGTIYTYSSLDTYNLNEVITHVIFPPCSQTPAVNLTFNMDVWNKISPKNQEIIINAYREHAKIFSQVALDDERRAIETAQKNGKITLVDLPEEDIQELKAAGRKSWAIAAKKSEKSAELIGLLTEYLKEKSVY